MEKSFGAPRVAESGVTVAKEIGLQDKGGEHARRSCARSPPSRAISRAMAQPLRPCWPTRSLRRAQSPSPLAPTRSTLSPASIPWSTRSSPISRRRLVAGLLITTEAMVAEKPKVEETPAPAMPPGRVDSELTGRGGTGYPDVFRRAMTGPPRRWGARRKLCRSAGPPRRSYFAASFLASRLRGLVAFNRFCAHAAFFSPWIRRTSRPARPSAEACRSAQTAGRTWPRARWRARRRA
jgi:hypothetical protein